MQTFFKDRWRLRGCSSRAVSLINYLTNQKANLMVKTNDFATLTEYLMKNVPNTNLLVKTDDFATLIEYLPS